jgi:hypothetical protein
MSIKSYKKFIVYKSIQRNISLHPILCKEAYQQFHDHGQDNGMECIANYNVPKIEDVDFIDKYVQLIPT